MHLCISTNCSSIIYPLVSSVQRFHFPSDFASQRLAISYFCRALEFEISIGGFHLYSSLLCPTVSAFQWLHLSSSLQSVHSVPQPPVQWPIHSLQSVRSTIHLCNECLPPACSFGSLLSKGLNPRAQCMYIMLCAQHLLDCCWRAACHAVNDAIHTNRHSITLQRVAIFPCATRSIRTAHSSLLLSKFSLRFGHLCCSCRSLQPPRTQLPLPPPTDASLTAAYCRKPAAQILTLYISPGGLPGSRARQNPHPQPAMASEQRRTAPVTARRKRHLP